MPDLKLFHCMLLQNVKEVELKGVSMFEKGMEERVTL